MTKSKMGVPSVLLLVSILLTGCQFIGNTQPQSSPIQSPTSLETAEPISNTNQASVTLDLPTVGQAVSSPFTVRGRAPGNWFFEGQIIGKLINAEGEVITTAPLMAEGEWMTTEMVTFQGAMSYPSLTKPSNATLRIENDNPSGLEEMQKFAEFTIILQ